MKRPSFLFLAIISLLMTNIASAQLLDFENIDRHGERNMDVKSYDGYRFLHTGLIGSDYDKFSGYTKTSGYVNSVVSGVNAIYSVEEKDITILKIAGGTFDLTSAWLAAAWENKLKVTVTGYLNGKVVNKVSTFVDTSVPTAATQFNFKNIDKVIFSSVSGINAGLGGRGRHFAIDDLQLNPEPAPVPEPSTYIMLFAGLGAIGLMALKRKIAK